MKRVMTLPTDAYQWRFGQGSSLQGYGGEHSDFATPNIENRRCERASGQPEMGKSFGSRPTKNRVTFGGALLFVKCRMPHSLGVLQTHPECSRDTAMPHPHFGTIPRL